MSKKTSDNKPDISKTEDRGEAVSAAEPLLLSETSRHRVALNDLALELSAQSAGLRRSMPERVQKSLSSLVRTMNCYYSNLIEGHDTHPVSAERAMKKDYSKDPEKRNLQIEARAHILVQNWIDSGGMTGHVTETNTLREIHRRFCEELPAEMLWSTDEKGQKISINPGQLREHDVAVGKHIAISPGAVPRFMHRFEEAFTKLGKSESLISAASAHHRLLWIHPFLDGNGRVARLMSHAMLLQTLDTGSLWSISRGLARRVREYKVHLSDCDLPRRNDMDGRGNLSEEALADFTRFFLEVCLDQVKYMGSLMQHDHLRVRIMIWLKEEIALGKLPQQSIPVMEAILLRGELPRGDVPALLNVTDRQTRRITKELIDYGILASDTDKSPLYLLFPAKFAGRWLPDLFPESKE